jgi:hypothetical protein
MLWLLYARNCIAGAYPVRTRCARRNRASPFGGISFKKTGVLKMSHRISADRASIICVCAADQAVTVFERNCRNYKAAQEVATELSNDIEKAVRNAVLQYNKKISKTKGA